MATTRIDLNITNQTIRSGIDDKDCTIQVSITVFSPTSEGGSDGKASANVTRAQGAVTYLWSTGATTPTILNRSEGAVSVTVTDSNTAGCTAFAEGFVKDPVDPPVPTCNLVLNSIDVVGTTSVAIDGTATVNFSGNAGAVTVVWGDDQTGDTAVGLPIGAISVALSDQGVGATCVKSGLAVIPNLNLRYLFLDGVNDKVDFSNVQISGDWVFQMEFIIDDFSVMQAFASSGNSHIWIFKNSTQIDIQIGATAHVFDVPIMSVDTFYYLFIENISGSLKLYLNNVESTTGSLTGGTIQLKKIGAFFSGSNPTGGGIDNFAIAAGTVTSGERTTLFNKPSTFDAVITPSVFYKCDETGNATTLVDESINNNDGTLGGYATGAPRFEDR